MRMSSIWASTSVLIKPWNGGLRGARTQIFLPPPSETLLPGSIKPSRSSQFKNPAVKLLCMHRSGRTVHNRPKDNDKHRGVHLHAGC